MITDNTDVKLNLTSFNLRNIKFKESLTLDIKITFFHVYYSMDLRN